MRILPLLHRSLGAALGVCLAASLSAPAQGQTRPPRLARLVTDYDSGQLPNPTSEPVVLDAFVVDVPGAAWLRLDLSEVVLERGLSGPPSELRLTSIADGAVQVLDANALEAWRGGSAFFNGDRVLVEILAAPRTRHRVRVRAATIGLPQSSFLLSPCFTTDQRAPSSDARVARLWPVGCTTWMLDDCHHCFLSAGHCAPGAAEVVQFNVPPSDAFGSVVHPDPRDQYVVDLSSVQSQVQGQGADWSYFGVFPNPITGQTPFERQGSAFAVTGQPLPTFDANEDVRVTGHGVDTTPPERNRVQQTHVGEWVSFGTDVTSYRADTTGGSSGSPVIHEPSGRPIAVHTNGGCTTFGGANSGTSLSQAALQAALASPRGICAGQTTTSFCNELDGALASCPCGNPGEVSSGCDLSIGSGGVALTLLAQEASPQNRATLRGSGYANFKSEPVIALRSATLDPARPVVFGDGLRCIGSTVVRMSTTLSLGGTSEHTIGHGVAAGDYYYQLWYRDPSNAFCTKDEFNMSSGLTLGW